MRKELLSFEQGRSIGQIRFAFFQKQVDTDPTEVAVECDERDVDATLTALETNIYLHRASINT